MTGAAPLLRTIGRIGVARSAITAMLIVVALLVARYSWQAALSQQLGILRMNGLVSVRRAQGFRFYSLAVPQTTQLLHCISTCALVTGA